MKPTRPCSPSQGTSIPASAWRRTTSLTAFFTRAKNAPSSSTSPCAFLRIMAARSSSRGKLPAWVVKIRSVLRRIALLLLVGLVATSDHTYVDCEDETPSRPGGATKTIVNSALAPPPFMAERRFPAIPQRSDRKAATPTTCLVLELPGPALLDFWRPVTSSNGPGHCVFVRDLAFHGAPKPIFAERFWICMPGLFHAQPDPNLI